MKLGFMQGRLVNQVGNKIQCFPYRNWQKEFIIASSLGFKLMEWTVDYKNIYKNPIMSTSGRKKVFCLKRKYKININSVTADFFMQKPFFKYLKKKEYLLNILRDFTKACSIMNFKFIVIPLVDNSSLKNNRDYENEVISTFNNLSNFFKRKKIKIIFESDYSPKKLKLFIKKFHPSVFGINYDIGNSAGLGYNFDQEMKEYYKYVKNVHIKNKNKKNVSVHLDLGIANIKNIIQKLKRKKFKGNLILQTARVKKNHASLINSYKDMIEAII